MSLVTRTDQSMSRHIGMNDPSTDGWWLNQDELPTLTLCQREDTNRQEKAHE